MGVRTYRYGMPRPPLAVRDAIDEQLHLAHRYRVALWHLARANRGAYRDLRRQMFPELVEVEAEVERLSAVVAEVEDVEDKAERRELRKLVFPQKVLLAARKARVRELRKEAKESDEFLANVETIKARSGVLQRALRAVFSRIYGLYSGTYLLVEDAARRANGGRRDPVRPHWDGARTRDFYSRRRLQENHGSGRVGIPFPGGRSVAQILGGGDPSLKLDVCGKRATLRYRLKSEGRRNTPVLVELPIAYHRPLPPEGRVKCARLVVQRQGLRCNYSIQFVVECADTRPKGKGTVAVCLKDDRIVWQTAGGPEHVVEVEVKGRRARDVQAGRDKERNAMIGALVAWSERQDELPDWLRDELDRQEDRPSARRLARFCLRVRPHLDARAQRALDRYVYHENHLYTWQTDMATNARLRVRDQYRVLARRLREQFGSIVVDDRRLDARPPTADRRDLRLFALKQCLSDAFGSDMVSGTGDSCEELLGKGRPEPSDQGNHRPLQRVS